MSRYQSNGFAKLRGKAKLPPTKDSLTLAQALTIGPSLIERFKAKGLISFKAAMPARYATPHRKKTKKTNRHRLHRLYMERIREFLEASGAKFAPLPKYALWSATIATRYGSLELCAHEPYRAANGRMRFDYSVFGRFTGGPPYPASANQFSGKWNYHPMEAEGEDEVKIHVDGFIHRLKGVLS